MTNLEYIQQRYPDHAQRIVEATYEQSTSLCEKELPQEYQAFTNPLMWLFSWNRTNEGSKYWATLFDGADQ